MARTRLTLTNDARTPRVVDLGGGVVWYAYLRASTLYVQREVALVRDAEVAVVTPVTWFDVVRDPVSPVGWIVFLHDGVLARIQVTNLAADPFNGTVLVRGSQWRDPVGPGPAAGTNQAFALVTHALIRRTLPFDAAAPGAAPAAGTEQSWRPSEGPDPPVLAIEAFYNVATRVLLVDLPSRTPYRNRRIGEVRLYRRETVAEGYLLYSTEPVVDADTRLYVSVPATGTPETRWFATSVRTGYQASEGPPSNTVVDDGNLPPIFLDATSTMGPQAGTSQAFATVTKPPVKRSTSLDPVGPGPAAGTARSWIVNGTDILNP